MEQGAETPTPTALIVGAGPTGMTAALALAAHGVPVRIIDKRAEPGTSSRALGLQARSMEVLHGLGVAQEVERVASRLRGATIMRGDRPLAAMTWVPPESRYPHTYVVPQAGVEAILRDRLADHGVAVERGVALTGVTVHETDARVALSTRAGVEHSRVPWVIGADGARSRVREAVGIGFPQHATGEVYVLADVQLELARPLGDSAMWLGPQGPLMLMRLPGDEHLWRIFADVTDVARHAELPALTQPMLAALLERRGPSGAQLGALRWTSEFRTRLGLADRYRAGRALIAGDAAHVFPPFGGQGMNLGIQDAVNLAWRIAAVERGADAALLDGYERERRPVAEATIDDVDARRRMYALRNPLARAARDLLLRIGGSSHRAARRGSLQNSQLATSYRASTPGGDRGPAPRPGDRIPHAPLAGASVHELLAADRLTLVRVDPDGGVEAVEHASALTTLHVTPATDTTGELRGLLGFGSGSGWLLVRPDGYVAARGSGPPQAQAPAASALVPSM